MEILDDILAEIQSVKNENQQLKQTLVELTKSINQIEIKPTVSVNSQKLSDYIWQNIEPKIGNVSASLKPQLEQFQTVASKIPNEIKQTQIKEFKIFNGNWFVIFGSIFLVLFLISLFLIPKAKMKYAENDVEKVYLENQILKVQIQNFKDKNPKLGSKYFE